MQKAKKGLLWIAIGILILPVVFSAPLLGSNSILDFYTQYYGWIDFIIWFMVFTSLARVFAEKKFGEDSAAAKPFYLAIGLALSLALTTWEVSQGFNLQNMGPIVLVILLIAAIAGLISIFKGKNGEKNKIKWAEVLFIIALILAAILILFPQLLQYLPFPNANALLGGLILLLLILAAYFIIRRLRRKKDDKDGKHDDDGNDGGDKKSYVEVEVCKRSSLLPGDFCEARAVERFKSGKQPTKKCDVCKREKIRSTIVVADERGNTNKKNEFMQGIKLNISTFIDAKKTTTSDVKLKWAIEDKASKKQYPVAGGGYFNGDLDVQSLDTASLPAVTAGTIKEINVKLIVTDPKNGETIDTSNATITILPSSTPTPGTVEPEVIVKETNTNSTTKNYATAVVLNASSWIQATPNAEALKLRNLEYNWMATKLDSSGNETGSQIPIARGARADGINKAELDSKLTDKVKYHIYCALSNRGEFIIKSNTDAVFDFIAVDLSGGTPPPPPPAEPEVTIREVTTGLSPKVAASALPLNAASVIEATPNATALATRNLRYMWIGVELDAAGNETGPQIPILRSTGTNRLNKTQIDAKLTNPVKYHIYCTLAEPSKFLQKSNGDSVMDFMAVDLSTTPPPPPPGAPTITVKDNSGNSHNTTATILNLGISSVSLKATVVNALPAQWIWDILEVDSSLANPVSGGYSTKIRKSTSNILDYADLNALPKGKKYVIRCYTKDASGNNISDSAGVISDFAYVNIAGTTPPPPSTNPLIDVIHEATGRKGVGYTNRIDLGNSNILAAPNRDAAAIRNTQFEWYVQKINDRNNPISSMDIIKRSNMWELMNAELIAKANPGANPVVVNVYCALVDSSGNGILNPTTGDYIHGIITLEIAGKTPTPPGPGPNPPPTGHPIIQVIHAKTGNSMAGYHNRIPLGDSNLVVALNPDAKKIPNPEYEWYVQKINENDKPISSLDIIKKSPLIELKNSEIMSKIKVGNEPVVFSVYCSMVDKDGHGIQDSSGDYIYSLITLEVPGKAATNLPPSQEPNPPKKPEEQTPKEKTANPPLKDITVTIVEKPKGTFVAETSSPPPWVYWWAIWKLEAKEKMTTPLRLDEINKITFGEIVSILGKRVEGDISGKYMLYCAIGDYEHILKNSKGENITGYYEIEIPKELGLGEKEKISIAPKADTIIKNAVNDYIIGLLNEYVNSPQYKNQSAGKKRKYDVFDKWVIANSRAVLNNKRNSVAIYIRAKEELDKKGIKLDEAQLASAIEKILNTAAEQVEKGQKVVLEKAA